MCFPRVIISAPSLEIFEFKTQISRKFPHFYWDMPLLKKVVFQLSCCSEESVPVVREMLMAVSHVEELHLDIEEIMVQKYRFHALAVSGLGPPTFSSLKHLNLEVCFYEYNSEDLVTLLQNSPALESLRLVHHKAPFWAETTGKNKMNTFWRSMLPRNAEGNKRHAYFEDLHISKNKEKLLRKLNRKQMSKRLKT